jgi:nicotinamide mononucleotide transporter
MNEILKEIIGYASRIDLLELGGLIFGLLAVWFLIKNNIWTWPSGIAYVLISFVIFWRTKLYADFALHVFYLILNIYGWYYWITGAQKTKKSDSLPVTKMKSRWWLWLTIASAVSIVIMGGLLSRTDASVPYWDSTTTVLSVIGMWLTARKKLENWHFWLVVDILSSGIYFYKEIYFYSALYLIYIGMAVAGYLSWKKIMVLENQKHDE